MRLENDELDQAIQDLRNLIDYSQFYFYDNNILYEKAKKRVKKLIKELKREKKEREET